ncbi:MAG TPA: pilus assembly protein [Deltaproteobacteria bacterium]|nr:pilus assembly protein [Deltaproteobacteria bacterium]
MIKQKAKLPDTNAILRYLLKDHDEHYKKAASFFEEVRIGKETVIILESVLVECVYILTKFYNVPREETANILRQFLGYKGIANSDRKDLIDALAFFAESNLDIVDAILHIKARNNRFTLFTFDRRLAKKQEN